MNKSNVLLILVLLLVVGGILGRYLYMQPKFINGETAQEIKATLPNGGVFSLSGEKGNYILIDFWGSWCGPCIAEFPDLKAMNTKFAGKTFREGGTFKVLSIAVEQDANRWQRAIGRFGLNWDLHILDLATNLRFFDSKIAKEYGVKELPTKYLINPDGQIVGVNLPFEEMDKMLTERLK